MAPEINKPNQIGARFFLEGTMGIILLTSPTECCLIMKILALEYIPYEMMA